ncbi:MAG: hypothetical protein U1F43_04105 [Myxococcota bacterium]
MPALGGGPSPTPAGAAPPGRPSPDVPALAPPPAPAPTPTPGVAPPDPAPHQASIAGQRDKLHVFKDPDDGIYVIAPADDGMAFYAAGRARRAGDPVDLADPTPAKDKRLYQQVVLRRLDNRGNGVWMNTLWAPRIPGPEAASIGRRDDGSYRLWCGNQHEIALTELVGDEAKAVLDASTFYSNPVVRQAYLLARDDRGVYYYIDALRPENGGGRHRVFIGRPGAMVEAPLAAVAIDHGGEVFATASGELRIVHTTSDDEPPSVTWIHDSERVALTPLPTVPSARLIYTELGIYPFIGAPCDDEP